MAEISIILPVYNSEEYIAQTLNSLLVQTFSDIEIICLNDGSTDNTLKILNEYSKKDSRIKVIDKENSGPANTRNIGLDNATGKYIMFCDSDDLYEMEMCERMRNQLLAGNYDYGCCSANIIIADNRPDIQDVDIMCSPFDELDVTNKLISSTDGYIWNKIFKKEIIDKYQIRFPDGHVHDDPAFVLQYCCVSKKLFVIPDKLYNYRIRNNSIMGQFYSKTKLSDYTDLIYMIKFVIEFLNRNNLGHDYLSGLNTKYMSHLIMGYTYVNKPQLSEFFDTISKYTQEIGMDNFSFIHNRPLIEAVFNNNHTQMIDSLNKILETRINKLGKEIKCLQRNIETYKNTLCETQITV